MANYITGSFNTEELLFDYLSLRDIGELILANKSINKCRQTNGVCG